MGSKGRESGNQVVQEHSGSVFLERTLLHLHWERFRQRIEDAPIPGDARALRRGRDLRETADRSLFVLPDESAEAFTVRRDVWLEELAQIIETHTLERARYYPHRLRNSAQGMCIGRINEIDLLCWKEYHGILTDSLWLLDHRNRSGAHLGWYWGNFSLDSAADHAPLHETGEWVMDDFAGSGTTLVECRRLGRNGLGVELNPETVARARERIAREPNPDGVVSKLLVGDSRTIDFRALLRSQSVDHAQLPFLHPPYPDIIRFSTDRRGLCARRGALHLPARVHLRSEKKKR